MASALGELGVSGLKQQRGYVDEEWLRQLQGVRGRRVLREMVDNDATVGAILFAIEMLLRNVAWRVEPFDDSPDRVAEAEFVDSCREDLSHTWADFVAEALSMLAYGFSVHEIVYKRRLGYQSSGAALPSSRFDDRKIGWRKLPLRSQDSLDRWEFAEDGGFAGVWQDDPQGGPQLFLPIEKLLLFRTTSRKNNPEGRSVLRNAYVDWYHKRRIQNFEAIGLERDLAGLPLLYVDPGLLVQAGTGDPASVARLEEYKKIVTNVRNDEQAGLILPADYDANGNRLTEFTLVGAGSGARRQFDTNAIVGRYARSIATTVLADFVYLGQEKVGSYSLSSDKTELFATALGAWLDELEAVLNRHAVPRLYAVNGLDAREPAQFRHADVEKPDVAALAEALTKLTTAGWLTPGAEEDEDWARELLGAPATPVELREELDEEAAADREAQLAALAAKDPTVNQDPAARAAEEDLA